MELEKILSNWLPIFLSLLALVKILKTWLKKFEKKIEENYQEKADYESLLRTIGKMQKTLDGNSKALDINSGGTLALLRFRLKEEISLAIARGYTTVPEYEVISDMYSAYKSMGGNHTIVHMFEDYHALEVRKGEN